MDLFNLSAILSLDKSGFDRGVDKADRQGRGLAKSLGKTIGGIGKSFLAMSAAAVGAFAGISTAFYSQVKAVSAYGDAVDKQSQKLGMSRRNYQMWGEILAYSGTSIDTMTMGMKTLNNAIVSGSKEGREAFSKLGLSEKELAKMSQEDAFATVVSAFQKMPEGAEKSALAVKLFGRNGQELLPTLNMTAEEMSALEQRVLDLGSIMGDDAVADSARFNDSLQDVSSAMRGFRNRIFASFLPSLSLVNEGLAEFIAGDDDGLEKVEEGIEGFVEKLSSDLPRIISKGGKILKVLGKSISSLVTKLWPTLSKSIGNMLRNLPQTVLTVATTAANGIIDIINATFGTNIPHVEAIVTWIQEKWESVKNAFANVKAWIAEKRDAVVTWVQEKWSDISSAFSAVKEWITGKAREISIAWVSTVDSWITTIGQWLSGEITLQDIALSFTSTVSDWIKKIAEWLRGVGLGVVVDFGATVADWIKKIGEWFAGTGLGQITIDFGAKVSGWIKTIKDWLENGISVVVNFFTGRRPSMPRIDSGSGDVNQDAVRAAVSGMGRSEGEAYLNLHGLTYNEESNLFERVSGGQAKGLDYVPTNDYLTRLHRGEAVLSANEARAWRESGGRGQSYGDTSAIVSAIQGLSNDMQHLRLYVGERAFAGAVVDYSGRRMNDYLGESSTRSRRGYGRR